MFKVTLISCVYSVTRPCGRSWIRFLEMHYKHLLSFYDYLETSTVVINVWSDISTNMVQYVHDPML